MKSCFYLRSLLAGLALLAACQRPEAIPPPADLLPREKMVQLLTAMHLLEARVEASRLSPDSARALYQQEEKNLLWQAEVKDSAFQRSYRYYGVHGKDLDDIYGTVLDSLTKRAAEMKK